MPRHSFACDTPFDPVRRHLHILTRSYVMDLKKAVTPRWTSEVSSKTSSLFTLCSCEELLTYLNFCTNRSLLCESSWRLSGAFTASWRDGTLFQSLILLCHLTGTECVMHADVLRTAPWHQQFSFVYLKFRYFIREFQNSECRPSLKRLLCYRGTDAL